MDNTNNLFCIPYKDGFAFSHQLDDFAYYCQGCTCFTHDYRVVRFDSLGSSVSAFFMLIYLCNQRNIFNPVDILSKIYGSNVRSDLLFDRLKLHCLSIPSNVLSFCCPVSLYHFCNGLLSVLNGKSLLIGQFDYSYDEVTKLYLLGTRSLFDYIYIDN